MNVAESTVHGWVDKYREGGLASISTKFASGRPTILDDSEMTRWLIGELLAGHERPVGTA
jgi:transposase